MKKNKLTSFFAAEENIKTHYFQGDMMLTDNQDKILNNAFKYASKRSDLENRALIKDMARLWPDAKVPYAYAADIGKGMQVPMCCVCLSFFCRKIAIA